MFDPNSNPIYGGTRGDWHSIVHKDYKDEPVGVRIMGAVDLPFSFIVDTVILPIDIYIWSEQPPAVDPLSGWKSTGGYPSQIITSNNSPANLPVSKTVAEDVQKFIREHDFKYGPGTPWFGAPDAMVFYEDGAGRHAVRMRVPLDTGAYTVVIYTLIYDKNDVRQKLLKYKWWRAASFG